MKKITLFTFLLISIISCKNITDLSDAYGNFEANPTIVSSEASGQLQFLQVEEGQKIPKGKLVALVDTTLLDLQRKQIEATIQTLPKKLRNTLADLEVLQKQKSNLIRERDRVNRLVQKKAATAKQLDDLGGQVDLVEKQMEALRAQTSLSNRAILSEKEPLLAQINIINEKIRKSYVRNPVEGTVLTKLSEPYEVVGLGAPLYRIGSLDTIILRFYASALQLQQVKIGDEIQVLVDQNEIGMSEYKGVITWISTEAEFTPKTIQTKEDRVHLVYAVKANVANDKGYFKIGMPAEVNFIQAVQDMSE